jgi:hypothetical protein
MHYTRADATKPTNRFTLSTWLEPRIQIWRSAYQLMRARGNNENYLLLERERERERANLKPNLTYVRHQCHIH